MFLKQINQYIVGPVTQATRRAGFEDDPGPGQAFRGSTGQGVRIRRLLCSIQGSAGILLE